MAVATIRIVAELAGVSTATVSRTLSRPETVSAETRERVRDAIKKTGFVPSKQAVDFRRQATRTIILLVRDISNPFYLDIYKGVEEFAFDAGYKVLMGDARNDDARICHYIEMVRNRQADGVILMTGRLPKEATAAPLPPVVVALEMLEDIDLPMVAIDNRGAAQRAVEHLLSLGHRRIVHVTGPLEELMNRRRHEGYLAALQAAGAPIESSLTVNGTYHLESGRHAVRHLLDTRTDFTAVFTSNDEMAVGVINELRAHGRKVPDDISVVGFDDIVFADAADPPLTTIRQARREIGGRAMAMMIGILTGEQPDPGETLIDVELIVRGTTAPAGNSTRGHKI
jgi:LacI family transcriptional regulator, repressor for deo operon, udp, cdd, tsx, nupC, and nupG